VDRDGFQGCVFRSPEGPGAEMGTHQQPRFTSRNLRSVNSPVSFRTTVQVVINRRLPMAFSQATKNAAFRRAGGTCECQMRHCGHSGRCNKPLGSNWEAHHAHSNSEMSARRSAFIAAKIWSKSSSPHSRHDPNRNITNALRCAGLPWQLSKVTPNYRFLCFARV
jgi:hypothetical protein